MTNAYMADVCEATSLIEVVFNGRRKQCNSVWAFEQLLKRFAACDEARMRGGGGASWPPDR